MQHQDFEPWFYRHKRRKSKYIFEKNELATDVVNTSVLSWEFLARGEADKNPLIWLAKQRERILRLHPAIFIYPMFSKNFIKEMYKIRPARAAFFERLKKKYRTKGGLFKGKWCTRRRAFDRGSYQELNCHISGFHSWRPTSYEINTLCDALSKNFVWKK